ncbi:sulfatase [Crateriforma spongiae]|uniref:sulfatase n=1 Tax=Crateriforma spongiae TaxID=2724528 RepID=UPI0039B1259C
MYRPWLLLGVLALVSTEALSSDRPNIVLFFVDDLGWSNLGYRQPDQFDTPNIDLLAQQGIDLQQAYVASPTCSPSRATLLTGQHPARLQMVRHIPGGPKHPDFNKFGRTDVEFNLWPGDPAQFPCRNWLPLEHVTYAEALSDLGYYNLFVGKWHLGHEPYHPIHQGFDRQIGTSNFGHPKGYYPPYAPNGEVFPDAKTQYLTDRITDETVQFISDYSIDQPLMISLWYYNVHTPSQGPSDLVPKYQGREGLDGKRAEYAAQVAAVDRSVGRVRKALADKGIDDNTLIIFTSDQGSFFEWEPYRGGKRVDTLCEGGARVPMIFHWPSVIAEGAVNESIVQTTDLFPTLVELAGGDASSYDNLDGTSLMPILRDNVTIQRNEPIFGYRAYEDLYASVRDGDWKLLVNRSGRVALYNVVKDRSEQHDLSKKRPTITEKLKRELWRWENRVGVAQFSGISP